MKRISAFFPLLLCFCAGLARWFDLVNCTDLSTGFPVVGSYLIRYGLLVGVIAVLFLFSLIIPREPRALTRGCSPAALLMLLSGGLFAGLGVMTLRNPVSPIYGKSTVLDVLMGALYLLTALWLVLSGCSRLGRNAREPSGNVVLGIGGTVSFLLLTFRTGLTEAANIQRIPVVWSALGALAALWFGVRMVRACYLPDTEVGRGLFLSGYTCFLLNTCLLLPQQICFRLAGIGFTTPEQLKAAAFGSFGLVGLSFAILAALSEETD